MQKRNLIVFDIDGTLTDSVRIHQDAFRKALTHIGVKQFNDAFGSYMHHTDSHIAKVIYENATGNIFDTTIAGQFESCLYDLVCSGEIAEIAGAGRMIRDIETLTDFGICYTTGSLLRPARQKLERIGVRYAPAQLVASDQIEEREKIVEQAIANAMLHYGTDRFERILSFGDGLWDLKTARNLSLEFIGIGDANRQLLQDHGMTRHYSDFRELRADML